MSRATRITDNYALLNNLHRLMWDASDAIMTVYRADDFGEIQKSDQSPVTRADLAAHHILVDGLRRRTQSRLLLVERRPATG
jgi:3'(2'), 5'-bisphosphate nucleotidase